ncbi:hypothetical protein QLS91_11665 [Flavobacterium sp. LB2P84]|uniref:Uncharacterized protein n=1 Tax=Flavobacterium yafengii TaxID=3041253 RepID=A0AAW6TSL4_9FLAO|nr:hypothetical protein [Flavobacterium yafengii]MDI5950360.1 hypothetical protein [Flavobacterium yafengii]MDI6033733.1 hypothetical protein [Flavobacterium yafengii]
MEKLIYPINGINYILFEIELPLKLAKKFETRIKVVDGIIQHTKYIENFWNRNVSIKCLIPERNIVRFKNL